MGLLDRLKGDRRNIGRYAEEARENGYALIDVREPHEFAKGRIPGAVNAPLRSVVQAVSGIAGKDDVLYVYCLSGGRSARACKQLSAAGFANVTNIGGINSYRGNIER